MACDQIGVPPGRFPYQTQPFGDGSPHVEILNGQYHFVISERGREFERRPTEDSDELLYWLLKSVTCDLGSDFAARHLVPEQDFRRVFWAKQLELLRSLNPVWEKWRSAEIARTLKNHPFDDSDSV